MLSSSFWFIHIPPLRFMSSQRSEKKKKKILINILQDFLSTFHSIVLPLWWCMPLFCVADTLRQYYYVFCELIRKGRLWIRTINDTEGHQTLLPPLPLIHLLQTIFLCGDSQWLQLKAGCYFWLLRTTETPHCAPFKETSHGALRKHVMVTQHEKPDTNEFTVFQNHKTPTAERIKSKVLNITEYWKVLNIERYWACYVLKVI